MSGRPRKDVIFIGRIIIVELQDQDSAVFDEIVEVLHRHPNLKKLEIELETVLSHPGIEIHLGQRKIYCNQCEVQLTAKEYDLLSLLVANKDRVLTYEQIYQRVWGEESFGGENGTIGYHISRLRGKLHEVLPNAPFTIRCVREVGYCLEVSEKYKL